MKSSVLAAVILGTTPFAAHAAPNDGIVGAYARVEVGRSFFDLSGHVPRVAVDDRAPAAKVLGGYRFNEHLGIEAGYAALGSFSQTVVVGNTSVRQEGRARSLFGVATGRLPLAEAFALHGRLGLSFGKVSGTDELPDSERLTGSRTSALVGIGAEYRPRPNVTLSVNFDHYGRLSENVTASAVVFGLHFTL